MANTVKLQEPATRTIGKYEVLGTLGRGSMGVVYKARDPEIGRIVAVKALRNIHSSQYHDTDLALERFRTEAKSAGNLRHPNIITIFEVNRDQEVPYLVMDYVEGESLDALIARGGPMPPATALQYLLQIAAGLDHAHQKGVVHRDIKPSNIIVDKAGHVFILDFGVATISESVVDTEGQAGQAKSVSGKVVGTPSYMSPEQILNEPLDYRSDLFSFATLAFECFTAQRPFPGDNFTTVVGNILNCKPLPVSLLLPDLPLSLEAEFERAFAKSPEARFPSAGAFVKHLCSALGYDPNTLKSSQAQLPDVPRKRPSSGWKSIIDLASRRREIRPGAAAATSQSPDVESSPWRFVDSPVKWRHDIPSGKMIRNTPGSIFRAVDDGSMSQAGNFKRFDFGSPFVRKLSRLVLLSCLGLGSILLWFLVEQNGQVGARIDEQGLQKELPLTLKDVSGVAQKFQPVPEGKTVSELSNREIMSLLADRGQSEAKIIEALNQAQSRGLPGLLDVVSVPLHSDHFAVRVASIKFLANYGDKRAVPMLVPMLNDLDPIVRGNAAKALGSLGDRASLGYLRLRMDQESVPEVKAALKKAVERINGFSLGQ